MAWRRKTRQQDATRMSDGAPVKKRGFRYLVIVVPSMCVVLCAVATHYVFFTPYFSIKQVRLHQQGHHVNVAEITPIISHHTQGSFFSFDVDRLRKRLLLVPWVESVTVRRHWPDGLSITLHERRPVAVWNESGLLDDQGALFYPSIDTFPDHLPRLSGKFDDPSTLWASYQRLCEAIQAMGLHVDVLAAVPPHAWQLTLSNGIVVLLPRENTDQAIHRWLSIYTQLMKGHLDEIKRIDLRYEHGLAVQWRSQKGALRDQVKKQPKQKHY